MPTSHLYNETELLPQIAAEDEQAFSQVYKHYSGKVYGMALTYLRSALTAQDAVQEVFSKVWQHRGILAGLNSFEAWLTTVTKNVLIDQLKKEIPVTLPEAGLPGTENSAARLDYRELEAIISHAISQLPERQRQVYQLNRIEGLSHREIAAKLAISYDTAREHMSKALKSIRAFLEKQYGSLGLLIALFWNI